jgi:hypothetical protein
MPNSYTAWLQVDGLARIGATTTINNGRVDFRSELGSNPESVERNLQTLVPPSEGVSRQTVAGEAMRRIQQDPPSSITMDFLSAGSQVCASCTA